MENQEIFEVKAFKGLSTHSPDQIPDDQFTILKNFVLNEVGELIPRPGIQFQAIDPPIHIEGGVDPLPDGTYNIFWVPPHNPYDPSLYSLPTGRKSGAPSAFIHCLVNGKLFFSKSSPPNFLRPYVFEGQPIQADSFYLSENSLYIQGSTTLHPNKLFRVFDEFNIDIVQPNLDNVSAEILVPWAFYHKGRRWAMGRSTAFPPPESNAVWNIALWNVDQWSGDDSYSPLTPWPSRDINFTFPITEDYATAFKKDTDSPVTIPEDLGFPLQIFPYRNVLYVLTTKNVLVITADGEPDQWPIEVLFDNVHYNSAFVHNDLIYLVGRDGVFVSDGNSLSKLSTPIDHEFIGYDWVYGDWPANSPGTNIELYNPFSQPQIYCYGNYLYMSLYTAQFSGYTLVGTERQAGPWIMKRKYFTFNLIAGGWTELEFPDDPRFLSQTWIPPTPGFVELDGVAPKPAVYFNLTGELPPKLGVYWLPWYLLDNNFVDEPSVTHLAYRDMGQFYDCIFKTKNFDFDLPWAFKRGHWGGLGYYDISSGTFSVNGFPRPFRPTGYSRFSVPKRFRETSLTLTFTPGAVGDIVSAPKLVSYNFVYTNKSKLPR